MATDADRGEKLDTWQQIADYLGVTTRTAQNWERKQAMPVHRLDGDKSRVWAYARELNHWRSRFEGRLALSMPVVETVTGEVESKPGPSRRSWLGYAAAGAAGAFVAGGLSLAGRYRLPARRQPTDFRISGHVLTILDEDGSPIWQKRFPDPIRPEFGSYVGMHEICVSKDFDGDGRVETLFCYIGEPAKSCRLICFGADGKTRWEFTPGGTVTDSLGQSFAPPYFISTFEVLTLPHATRVIVSGFHHSDPVNQLAVVDLKTGARLNEYWHRGHLPHVAVADLDGDGKPEVLVGGVNDGPEFKCGSMIVFDYDRISGASRNSAGLSDFRDIPPGTERRIFFPKSLLCKEEYNRVRHIRPDSGKLTVEVVESIRELESNYFDYHLDYGLRVLGVSPSAECQAALKELQSRRQAQPESIETIANRLRSQVRVL